MKKSLEE